MTESSGAPVIIVIDDPETGSRIEYKVHPTIAKALKVLLDAGEATTSDRGPSWDSACRV